MKFGPGSEELKYFKYLWLETLTLKQATECLVKSEILLDIVEPNTNISGYYKVIFSDSSPLGEIFRARLRQFPALVNCCTIDWFSNWPADALKSVALKFLQDIPELDTTDEVMDGLVCIV